MGTGNNALQTQTPRYIIIGLVCFLLALGFVVTCIYWYVRFKNRQKATYQTLNLKPKRQLKVKISTEPADEAHEDENEKACVASPGFPGTRTVRTYSTPIPPKTPFLEISNLNSHARSSLENVRTDASATATAASGVAGKERSVDLWKRGLLKANAVRYLTPNPKNDMQKTMQCANGKVKFHLLYNKQGQKELIVKLLEFVDLPLSRETGYTIPFVKVYLYPQAAHANETIKTNGNVETMCFPQETTCSFVGYSYEKICSHALKFVILDYDRFSRSEFVAECVTQLDEVSLEGEVITQHLSIQRLNREKDLGMLLVSLCYQPNLSRMSIGVLKASDLPEVDGRYVADYYVKISLTHSGSPLDKRRTKTIKKSVYPVFNEVLTFTVDCQTVRSLVLIFDVIRVDSKIRHEKIASVVLGNHTSQRQVLPHEIQHFNEMLSSPHRQIAEWHKLVEN